ncbi:MAG: LysR family transcriptional regulator [Negativicutes bacterium]|nr:LysR family transcriptional regulator [Negativicutes bacterium]
MSRQQLATFRIVVEQNSFARAAECLYMAQSSVSQQIGALERYYGVLLFSRSGKKCIVTPEGRLLYDLAKEILTNIKAIPDKLKELQTLKKGRLRVGASSTVGTYLLPAILRRYRELYPQVELSIKAGYGHQMVDLVRNQVLDLAMVGHNLNWLADPTLRSIPVSQDRLSLIVWPGHKWCGRDMVEPEELLDGTIFIHARQDSGMRSVVDKFLYQENLVFKSVIEMANHESIKRAVEERIGFSLISSVAIQDELKTGRLAEVRLNRLNSVDRNFLLISRANQELNPAELAFIRLVEEGEA